MSRVLRGHLQRATSAASTAAIRLASIQDSPDEFAAAGVEDALGQLVSAVIITMEAVGIDAEQLQRRRLYRDLTDFVGGGQ